MNAHYWQMFVAFLLAQSLMTSVLVYNYQKEKNVAYNTALFTYLKAEVGYFVIGVIGILCILFILSDFIDLSLTKKDLLSLESRGWKENLQLYFKSASLLVGGFVQYLAFRYRKNGKDAIDKIIGPEYPGNKTQPPTDPKND